MKFTFYILTNIDIFLTRKVKWPELRLMGYSHQAKAKKVKNSIKDRRISEKHQVIFHFRFRSV